MTFIIVKVSHFLAKFSFYLDFRGQNSLRVPFSLHLFQEVSPHHSPPLGALRSSIKQIEIRVVIYTSLFVVAVRNERNKIDFKLKVFCHYSLKSAWISSALPKVPIVREFYGFTHWM